MFSSLVCQFWVFTAPLRWGSDMPGWGSCPLCPPQLCPCQARCQIYTHKLGKVPNLYSVQIQQSAKCVRSIQASCQICEHKLAKSQICTVFKFSKVSNLITAQIWQGAKIVQSIQAMSQIFFIKSMLMFVNLYTQIQHFVYFVCTMLACCLILARKFTSCQKQQ